MTLNLLDLLKSQLNDFQLEKLDGKRFTRNDDAAGVANERVMRAHEWARGFAYAKTKNDIDDKVLNAHDHKGCLTVTWSEMPDATEIEAYNLAWVISANENDVDHKLFQYEIIERDI